MRKRRTSIRRRLRMVTLLTVVQLVASAYGVHLVTLVELYGALAAIGVVPVWRQPYTLRCHRLASRGTRPSS